MFDRARAREDPSWPPTHKEALTPPLPRKPRKTNTKKHSSLGDLDFKEPGPFVSADPDVARTPLLPHRDRFVVLASDGLWDVMTDSDAVAVAGAAIAALERRRRVLLEAGEGVAAGVGGTGGNGAGGGGGGGFPGRLPSAGGFFVAGGGSGSEQEEQEQRVASAAAARAARVAADALLHEALRRGTLDNVTVVVMLLEWR